MPNLAAPLIWDESYATGVKEIDDQHMILVHTLNQASQQLAEDSSLELLRQITQDLLSYALYHFETEEELMQEFAYEQSCSIEAKRHLDQHRAFSAKVVEIHDGLKRGTPIDPVELIDFLNQWLINHILNTDKHLGAHISAQRGAG